MPLAGGAALGLAADRPRHNPVLASNPLAADRPEAVLAMPTAVVPAGQEGRCVGIQEPEVAAMPRWALGD